MHARRLKLQISLSLCLCLINTHGLGFRFDVVSKFKGLEAKQVCFHLSLTDHAVFFLVKACVT